MACAEFVVLRNTGLAGSLWWQFRTLATHSHSLHSVSPVVFDGYRRCVSNYYFSEKPLLAEDTFHVTSFRGRPENKLADLILQADTFLRMGIRKVFKKGLKENPHVYKKDQ